MSAFPWRKVGSIPARLYLVAAPVSGIRNSEADAGPGAEARGRAEAGEEVSRRPSRVNSFDMSLQVGDIVVARDRGGFDYPATVLEVSSCDESTRRKLLVHYNGWTSRSNE